MSYGAKAASEFQRMACPFCHPEGDANQKVVLENEFCRFLQQPQKVLVGSGVIVPKQHRETLFDLTDEEWMATFSLVKQAKQLLDVRYHPQGYNLGWNTGRVAGQEVLHVHLHVIPRFEDEPLAGKGIRHWIKQAENSRFQ